MNKFRLSRLTVLAFLFGTLICSKVSAQHGVAINSTGAPADTSAILDVSSNSKGLLVPRMTEGQRDAIALPAEGLQIFNTTSKCLQIYIMGVWQSIYCGCNLANPGPISGLINLCSGQSGVTYSISPINGATTYTWTVPSGSMITSGQGSNTIVVDIGSTSGIISVVASNSCSNSAPGNLSITVTTAPAVPGAITGPTTVASGQTNVSYSVTNVSGINYSWTVPPGANIASGQGSNSITVNFGSTPGNVCVTAGNSCDTSAASCSPITISTCPPGSQTFTYTGSIQTFTVPSCVTSLTIEAWGAQGGSVSVTCAATGGLGARMSGTFAVTGGEVLSVLVGQQGYTNGSDGGGGGGSFVVRTGNIPLIIAGGGGGATNNIANCGSNRNGVNASITTSGTASADGVVAGGTGGNGGGANVGSGGGGGGFNTDGTPGSGTATSAGKAYVNGGAGGTGLNNDNGGYGGGGAGWFTGGNGGGGGGYSGGGTNGNTPYSGGGGGGSYNIGTNPSNSAGVQTGNGQVVITW